MDSIPDKRERILLAASRLIDGGRTLILFTDPHPREATYSVTLPGLRAEGATGPGAGVRAVTDDEFAAHDDVRDANRVLVRRLERGAVRHRCGIECDEVCHHPGRDTAAVAEAHACGRQ